MGFDLRSIPVRLGSEPMRRIRDNADLWNVARVHPPFGPSMGEEQLPEISRALLAEVPATQGWTGHFLDRSHNQAEYVLDPVAFRNRGSSSAEAERSMPHRVIYGDEVFAAHARGGQGVPWRCSGTAFLRQAAAWIDAIDPAAIRREFSVSEMNWWGLYKAPHPAYADDDEYFDLILQHLRDLAAHYSQVAGRGLDLIVQLD